MKKPNLMNESFITESLAKYIVEEKFTGLPRKVISRAKQCVQDALGCILGAYATRYAAILIDFAKDRGGNPESHLLGTSIRTSCTTAAYTNALLVNTLDYDDVHQGHMGATVMAAAFAVGEQLNSRGRELITAIVAGYEVSLRIGRTLHPIASRKWIHGHGTWQTFGATAAAAKLLKLDVAHTAHALAIAGANAPVASVMKTVYGSNGPDMVKNNFGTAAEVGVTAALLAERGMEGPLDLFEGETGFWRMFGSDHSSPEGMVRGLGREYDMLNVGFKMHPACRILQSVIQAAGKVGKQARIQTPGQVEKVIVHAPSLACAWPFTNTRPRHMWAAQFSTPYTVAMALTGQLPGPDWFAEGCLSDSELLNLADRIELIPIATHGNKELEQAGRWNAPGEVALHARNRTYHANVTTARGEADNPFSAKQRDTKFDRLARHKISETQASVAKKKIARLEEISSVRVLAGAIEGKE